MYLNHDNRLFQTTSSIDHTSHRDADLWHYRRRLDSTCLDRFHDFLKQQIRTPITTASHQCNGLRRIPCKKTFD